MRAFALLMSFVLIFVSVSGVFAASDSFERHLASLKSKLEASKKLKHEQGYYFVDWCGLERIVKVVSPFDKRLALYEIELKQKNLSTSRLFEILRDMRNIYYYEYRSEEDFTLINASLLELAKFYMPARVEVLLSAISTMDMLTHEGNTSLHELLKQENIFPYNNGYLPVIELDYIRFMTVISDMALGIESDLPVSKAYFGFRGLSVQMLYDFAFNRKSRAYLLFETINVSQNKQVKLMLSEVLEPMYLAVGAGERAFLAGLAASEFFSDVATEMFLRALTEEPRLQALEHGLGVLAQHYRAINAYVESEEVLKNIRAFYPNSGWLSE